MTAALNLLLRVIRRRVERDEALAEIWADYPKLTEAQRAELEQRLA